MWKFIKYKTLKVILLLPHIMHPRTYPLPSLNVLLTLYFTCFSTLCLLYYNLSSFFGKNRDICWKIQVFKINRKLLIRVWNGVLRKSNLFKIFIVLRIDDENIFWSRHSWWAKSFRTLNINILAGQFGFLRLSSSTFEKKPLTDVNRYTLLQNHFMTNI